MKKALLTFLLTAGLVLMLAACGGNGNDESGNESDNDNTPTNGGGNEAQILGQETFDALVAASDLTEGAMNTIHRAWNWAVNSGRRGSVGTLWRFSEFLWDTGLGQDDVLNAIDSFERAPRGFSNPSENMVLVDFNDTLTVTIRTMSINGTYDEIRAYIEAANAAIRTLSTEHSDFAHLQALTDLYIAVSGGFEWSESPTGSLSTAGEIIRDFETNVRAAKTSLGFVFD